MRHPRPVSLGLALGLAALACPVAALGAGATTSGTLSLVEGGAAAALELDYSWSGAPLLRGPAASRRVGATTRIRDSATRYAPVSLVRVAAPLGTAPAPDPNTCDGFSRRPVEQSVSVGDRRALLQVEMVELDVLRRRGTAHVGLARTGDGALAVGEYTAPGLLRVDTRGCTDVETGAPVLGPDGGPYVHSEAVSALAVRPTLERDRLLGPWTAEALERVEIPLRRRDGAWRGSRRVSEPDAGSYGPATRSTLTIALRGTPASLVASCRIPRSLLWPSARVRSRAAALRLLRQAGFPRARYAGVRPGVAAGLRGKYAVVGYDSGSLPCGFPVKLRYGTD